MENEKEWHVASQEMGESVYNAIKELVDAVNNAKDDTSREEAEQAIDEDPLSVTVRTGWVTPGDLHEPEEYCILLGTGGPAYRIVGTLNGFLEPDSARIEVQDWFEPWTEYRDSDQDVLLQYAGRFYYGG
jgi:hypothetical protein